MSIDMETSFGADVKSASLEDVNQYLKSLATGDDDFINLNRDDGAYLGITAGEGEFTFLYNGPEEKVAKPIKDEYTFTLDDAKQYAKDFYENEPALHDRLLPMLAEESKSGCMLLIMAVGSMLFLV